MNLGTGAAASLAMLLSVGCSQGTSAAGNPPQAGATAGMDAAAAVDGSADSAAGPDAADSAAGGSEATSADATAADSDSVDSTAASSQWCGAWAQATCALWTQCPLAVGGQNLAQCQQNLQKECQGSAALDQALAAGRIKFDAAKAAQCLEGLQKTSCPALYQAMTSQPGAAVAACAQVLVGQQPAGAACTHVGECAAGAQCVFGASCPGKCQAWSKVNQPCSAQAPCEPGVATCSGGSCAALASAVGGKCIDYQCALPLYCNVATGTCAQLGLADAPCTASGQLCWAGLTCFAPAGQSGTCKPLGVKGSACLSHANCNPLGPQGALLCIGGTCQVGPGPGAPCFDWQCSGGWCDSTALPPTCQGWPALGKPCALGALCGPGAVCSSGLCKALGAAGQPCLSGSECLSGACYGGTCAAGGKGPCG